MHLRARRSVLVIRQVFLCLVLILVSVNTLFSRDSHAATFTMKSGYYMGNGGTKAVTNLGFQPDFVLVKASASFGGVAVFTTSAMPSTTMAYVNNAPNSTSSYLVINTNGFTVGNTTNVNSLNVIYYWVAIAGNDCSSTGVLCVGTYNGTGTATQTISTGFQPSMTMVKQNTSIEGHYRTASMPANRSEFFSMTAADTGGSYIQGFNSTGFTVGTTDNTSGGSYYYVALKTSAGIFNEGSYTGIGVAGLAVTSVGFQPAWLVVKNATSATSTNKRPVMYTDKSYGDIASYFEAVSASNNLIQGVQSTGFTVGSNAITNETGQTMYWFAVGSQAASSSGSGNFRMAEGTFTGTGTTLAITGVGFSPNIVYVKGANNNHGVMRFKQTGGDYTSYSGTAAADFTTGITSIDSDGFTMGISSLSNASGIVYQWQAFGNAYDTEMGMGSNTFATGAYYGTGGDDRSITGLPFKPDLVVIKSSTLNTGAVFRTSAQTGDTSSQFAAAADTANLVQQLNSDGFQIGSSTSVNSSGEIYRWFAFKKSAGFDVGTYTGNATAGRAVATSVAPNLVWTKQSTAVAAYLRPATLSGDATQAFSPIANTAGLITSLTSTGFTLGSSSSVNANNGTYWYAAWTTPPGGTLSIDIVDATGAAVTSPSVTMNSASYSFTCSTSTGTFGTSSQRLRVSNQTASTNWSVSMAPTAGPTATWANSGGTVKYDINDPSGGGCSDGGDADTVAGQMTIRPSTATITPQSGCSTTGITLSSDQSFNQGVVDAITLASSGASANTLCYWDMTNVGISQKIPAETPINTYSVGLTATVVSY